MHDFTPVRALCGGALLGVSASLMWLWGRRVAGVSGIVSGLWRAAPGERGWRLAFLAGLLVGGVVLRLVSPSVFGAGGLAGNSWPVLVVAGVLVGFGSRLGGGCTSGHGICGMSRLSFRSLAAVLVFIAAGV